MEVKIEHDKIGPESRESHRLEVRRKGGSLGGQNPEQLHSSDLLILLQKTCAGLSISNTGSVCQLLNTYITNGVVGYVCQVLVRVLLYLSVPISSVILASSIPFRKTGFFAYSIFTSISEYLHRALGPSCHSFAGLEDLRGLLCCACPGGYS